MLVLFFNIILGTLLGMLYTAVTSDFFSLRSTALIIISLEESSQVLPLYGSHCVNKGSREANGESARQADGCDDKESWEKARDGKR